ncbi:hypothetical protein BY996DRAFT_6505016 [Phakopsora pachyrhizi]|nr:hypothetical protein BY996DRAFT_6505016 [Phakopsora pachyrhizi]
MTSRSHNPDLLPGINEFRCRHGRHQCRLDRLVRGKGISKKEDSVGESERTENQRHIPVKYQNFIIKKIEIVLDNPYRDLEITELVKR